MKVVKYVVFILSIIFASVSAQQTVYASKLIASYADYKNVIISGEKDEIIINKLLNRIESYEAQYNGYAQFYFLSTLMLLGAYSFLNRRVSVK